ncbi:DUF3833 family protein [Rhodoplanes roseus]|uniref:DUF3833 domain-containing protein n=1 Tax=Rhodoplanes roseus TaxID=29409 RepID=A0A327KXV7_9BRAD|nr:DUF3833 family protein [Rhodoplanes roseus]RAI43720.1 hypothetical protein CH341_12865 [Rhodoplanes roseus]
MKIDDFAGRGPELKPEEFLTGRLEGWAVLESPLGGLSQRASVTAEGCFDDATATLHFHETWTFDDGHTDTLRWRIRRTGPGHYTGSEDRLEGEAEGEQAGFAFHWRYTRDVPQKDGGSTKLNFDDWFWRIDDEAVIVKGTAGRLGLPFASAHVTYRRAQ